MEAGWDGCEGSGPWACAVQPAAWMPLTMAGVGWLGRLLLRRLLLVGLGRGGRLTASGGVGVWGPRRSVARSVTLPVWCLSAPPVGLLRPLLRLGCLTVLRRRRPLLLGTGGVGPGRRSLGPLRPVVRLPLSAILLGLLPVPLLPLSPGMPAGSVRWVGGSVSGPPLSGLSLAMPLVVGLGATTTGGGPLLRANPLRTTGLPRLLRTSLCGQLRLGGVGTVGERRLCLRGCL